MKRSLEIIENEQMLIERLLLDSPVVSYINLANVHSIGYQNWCFDNFCFYVDSSRLADFLGIENVSVDFSSAAAVIIENFRSIGFIGGTSDEVELFGDKLNLLYPNKSFKLFSGYFEIESIRSWSDIFEDCEIVFVSMGYGLQEEVARLIRDDLGKPVICCGAFISQEAKMRDKNYYPAFVAKLNLRWLYRLLLEVNARRRFYKVLKNYLKMRFYGKKSFSFRCSI